LAKLSIKPSNLVVLLSALAGLFLMWSFTSGFRLSTAEAGLAWQANSTRLIVIFAAGFAQCAGLAVLKPSFGLQHHTRLYLCLVAVCVVFAASSHLPAPVWLAILLAVLTASLAFYLSRKIETSNAFGRLVLGVVLYVAFFVSAAVYFAASAQSDNALGGVVLWLFSSADVSAYSATWVLAALFTLIAALIGAKEIGAVSVSAIAVSIGLVGPLVFVGYFAALILPSQMSLRSRALMAGLLGGTFIVATASLTQLLFGGYSPALIIPLAFFFIPLVLWRCRYDANEKPASIFEKLLLVLVACVSIGVVMHIAKYAQGLI